MHSAIIFLATLAGLSGVRTQLLPVGSQADRNSSLPIQIEVHLLRFQNPHGIVYSGKKCDFFAWGCDISASAYLDLVKPYADFPGQREIQNSDNFWYEGENSSPTFNRIFTLTVCEPDTFKDGNLRVHMKDVDGFMRGGDDHINDFNCILRRSRTLTTDPNTPWSEELACDAVYANPLMGLFYKFRMYRLEGTNGKCNNQKPAVPRK